MANTIVSVILPHGLTSHVIKLYQADTLVNTAGGDALTAGSNNTTLYTATVTEAVTGDVFAEIENSGGTKIAGYVIYGMDDDTDTYPCQEPVPVVKLVEVTTTNTDMRGTDSAYTGTPPTVGAIADQVWDESSLAHVGINTMGYALNQAHQHAESIEAAIGGGSVFNGTIGATGNDTTHLHLVSAPYGDDELNDYMIVVLDVSATTVRCAAWIDDWDGTAELATISPALPFTPEDSVDLYWVVPVRRDGVKLGSSQTTNITGNITGNLSGSVGSVTGAVGSVTGAVGSVTGAVGSVTGNVGGNVSGSVGSVLGEINATAGTIKTLDALDTAQDSQHGTTQTYLTNNLGTAGAAATEAGGTGDHLTELSLSSTERDAIATALLDLANGVETSWTLRQAARIVLSALAGKVTSNGTTSWVSRDMADSKDRITATTTTDGSRTAVTKDAT